MKRRTLLKAAAGATLAGSAAQAQNDQAALYVSPKGSDERGTGRLDKPFATPARALAAARGTSVKRIFLRTGTYEIAETLTFTREHSGIRMEAWPGESVTLSGGTKLGIKQAGAGRWEAKTALSFEQLYVNGQRRYRPRFPKNSYYRVAKDLPLTEGRGYERLAFEPGQLKETWSQPREIEVLCFQVWTMARMKIKRIREGANIVEFTGQTIGREGFQAFSEGKRFILENVKEALSDPGEWFLDKPTQTLTYIPLFDEKIGKSEIFAPRLSQLVQIDGAKDVYFGGIIFAHAAWSCPEPGDSFWQAEAHQGAAIEIVGGRNVTLERCTVKNVGAWAVSFGAGCKDCQLLSCTLTDLGAGGVKIGEKERQKDDEKLTERITVTDCLIAHGGRISPAGIGIWLGHSPYNKILRNEITDFYYTGISPGWSWGYGESGAHHNEIAFNKISKIGQSVLSDMGGIYTLGVAPGTTLHHNIISEIESDEYGGWGIYFDEGTTGVIAENNLVYKTRSAPFHQHYGRENSVKNNIFAFGTQAQLMRTRAEEHKSFTLEKNIILWKEGPLLGSNWSGTPDVNYSLSGNLYWKTDGSAQLPEADKTGLVADPKFTDPLKGDFRLKPGSPAAKIGFVPWDFALTGRKGQKPYTGEVPRAYPLLPPPPPPRPLALDFEELAVGQPPTGRRLTVYTEPDVKDARIFVADDFALSGKKSLKFTDAPGQKGRYNPHLFFKPGELGRVLVGSFGLRLGPGAVFYHEWRDDASPYKTGPSLRIEKGELLVGGKTLMTLPSESWVRFAIRHALGSGVWELTVQLPGRTPPRKLAGLACGSRKSFDKLAWWGFVSDADAQTTFWLDDIALKEDIK